VLSEVILSQGSLKFTVRPSALVFFFDTSVARLVSTEISAQGKGFVAAVTSIWSGMCFLMATGDESCQLIQCMEHVIAIRRQTCTWQTRKMSLGMKDN
jgi:hypothetical protein